MFPGENLRVQNCHFIFSSSYRHLHNSLMILCHPDKMFNLRGWYDCRSNSGKLSDVDVQETHLQRRIRFVSEYSLLPFSSKAGSLLSLTCGFIWIILKDNRIPCFFILLPLLYFSSCQILFPVF